MQAKIALYGAFLTFCNKDKSVAVFVLCVVFMFVLEW